MKVNPALKVGARAIASMMNWKGKGVYKRRRYGKLKKKQSVVSLRSADFAPRLPAGEVGRRCGAIAKRKGLPCIITPEEMRAES